MDFSRQRIDQEALYRLYALVDFVHLRDQIEGMFRGDPINRTEDRAVLHVALRQPRGAAIGGPQIAAEVMAERDRMLDFATAVREGRIVGSAGRPFTLVVNIGIGGSDLGPAMAVSPWRSSRPGHPRWPSSRMSTAAISTTCWPMRMRRPRCSSWPPRPSPRSRP